MKVTKKKAEMQKVKHKTVKVAPVKENVIESDHTDDETIAYYNALIETSAENAHIITNDEDLSRGRHVAESIPTNKAGNEEVKTDKITAVRVNKLFEIDHGVKYRGILPILYDYYSGSRKTYLLRADCHDDFYDKMFPIVLTKLLGTFVTTENIDMQRHVEIQHVVDQLDVGKLTFTVNKEHDWILRYPIFYTLCSFYLNITQTKSDFIIYNVSKLTATHLRMLLELVKSISLLNKTIVFVVDELKISSYEETDLGVFFGSGSLITHPYYKNLHEDPEKKLKLITTTVITLCDRLASVSKSSDLQDMTFNVSYIREFIRSGKAVFEFPICLGKTDVITISSIDVILDILTLSVNDTPVELYTSRDKVTILNPYRRMKNFCNKWICKTAIAFLNLVQDIKSKVLIFAEKITSEIIDGYKPNKILSTVKSNLPSFLNLGLNKRIGLGTTVLGGSGLIGAILGCGIDIIVFTFLDQRNSMTNIINLVIEPILLVLIHAYYLFKPNIYRNTSMQYSDVIYYHNTINTIHVLDDISTEFASKMTRWSLNFKSRVIYYLGKVNVQQFRIIFDKNLRLMRQKVQMNKILFKGDLLLGCLAIVDLILSLGLSITSHQLRAAMGLWSFVEQTSRMQGKLAEQVKGVLSKFSMISSIDRLVSEVIILSVPITIPAVVVYICYQLVKFHHKWMEVIYKQFAAEGNKDSFKRAMEAAEKTAKYNKSVVSYFIVSFVTIIKMPTTALKVLMVIISSILGINNADTGDYNLTESILLMIVGLITVDINSLVLAIVWLTIGGTGHIVQLLEVPVIVYISDILVGGLNDRQRAIRLSKTRYMKYKRADIINPRDCSIITESDGSYGHNHIVASYHMFAKRIRDSSIRNKAGILLKRKQQLIDQLIKNFGHQTVNQSTCVKEIIETEKVTQDEDPIGNARSIFHVGFIPNFENTKQDMMGLTRKFSYDKRIAAILNVDIEENCYLNNTGISNAAIGLRRRTQPTTKAFNDWKKIAGTEMINQSYKIIVAILRDRRIVSSTYTGLSKYSVYHNIKPNVTPGYVSTFISGIKKYKTLISIMLKQNDITFSTLNSVRFLHSCFVKDEMLKAKPEVKVSGPLEQYMQENIYTGKKIGNFPRIIIPAESTGRFIHQYTQTVFNNCLLLSRFRLPVKIGLKTSNEWSITVNNNFIWSVSIDITSFDGNQHRGFDIIAGLIREGCRTDNFGDDLLHALETSLKIVIMSSGDINVLTGSQASGDINTSSSNSMRLLFIIILGLLTLTCDGLQILFICQGDNALFQCDDINALHSLCNIINNYGLPVRIEGICNMREDVIKIPAYLGAIGIKVHLNFISLTNGRMFSISRISPWRDFDRYIPKLATSNKILNHRNMEKRTNEKLKCWLATYPTDLVLWSICDLLRLDMNKIQVTQVDESVEYAGHANLEDMKANPSVWIAKNFSLRNIAIPISISTDDNVISFVKEKMNIDIKPKYIETNPSEFVAAPARTVLITQIDHCFRCFQIRHLLDSTSLNHKVEIYNRQDLLDNDYDNIIICERFDKYEYVEFNKIKLITSVQNFNDCAWMLSVLS